MHQLPRVVEDLADFRPREQPAVKVTVECCQSPLPELAAAELLLQEPHGFAAAGDPLVSADEVTDLVDGIARSDGRDSPVPLDTGVTHNQPDTDGRANLTPRGVAETLESPRLIRWADGN